VNILQWLRSDHDVRREGVVDRLPQQCPHFLNPPLLPFADPVLPFADPIADILNFTLNSTRATERQ
jgi:hypothetical protein